jgi:hypothetical protein
MKLEAPPQNWNCLLCDSHGALYRCVDCLHTTRLLCFECCIKRHHHLPFHRIKRWTGKFFEKDDLGSMGLTISLGHGGTLCPQYHSTSQVRTGIEEQEIWDGDNSSEEKWQDDLPGMENPRRTKGMVFVTSSGIFRCPVNFCLCPNALPMHLQLFQMCFFPASLRKPSTAFTFDVLKLFHTESIECKTAASTFCSKLQRITNAQFTSFIPVSGINSFLCMIF